ncbi:MAG: SHOCT domain-containing protein [Desulfosarcinaceae bacterium]
MITKRLLALGLPVLPVLIAGCSRRPVGGGYMPGWDHMMGTGAYGGMLMWLIVIIVIAFVVYLIVNRNLPAGGPRTGRGESALDILKRRYAEGEISKEEFDRMKREIGE